MTIDLIINLTMAFLFVFAIAMFGYYFYLKYEHRKWINAIFHIYDDDLLDDVLLEKKADFLLRLHRAGMKEKDYYEIVGASVITGLVLLFFVYYMSLSFGMNIFIILLAVGISAGIPKLYVEEQTSKRIKRIDDDLAIFIDLLIIILEAGGGLNNAIDQVTRDAREVLGPDLLGEADRFKNEFIAYSSTVAYDNLAKRTGSSSVAAIVGYMRLSEETGIGVKSVFENQSKEIKAAEILGIEKQAATLNLKITVVVFAFILPALMAMMALPFAFGNLMPKF
jgi:tight adherence protein C